jgi:predicted transcriptional regulator
MRAHIILDNEIVKDIDNLVGKRKRSRFIVETVCAKLRQIKLQAALTETAGMLSEKDNPEWRTSEDVANWVSESRKKDGRRLKGSKFD